MLTQMNITDVIYRWGKREVESVRNNTPVHLFHSHFRKQILSIMLIDNVNCACVKCRQAMTYFVFASNQC